MPNLKTLTSIMSDEAEEFSFDITNPKCPICGSISVFRQIRWRCAICNYLSSTGGMCPMCDAPFLIIPQIELCCIVCGCTIITDPALKTAKIVSLGPPPSKEEGPIDEEYNQSLKIKLALESMKRTCENIETQIKLLRKRLLKV